MIYIFNIKMRMPDIFEMPADIVIFHNRKVSSNAMLSVLSISTVSPGSAFSSVSYRSASGAALTANAALAASSAIDIDGNLV